MKKEFFSSTLILDNSNFFWQILVVEVRLRPFHNFFNDIPLDCGTRLSKKKDHQIFWPSKFPSRNFFPTIFPVFDWHWFNFNILAVQFSHFCEILLSMFPQETIYCRNHHLIFPESSSHVPVLSFVEVNGKKQSASVNNNFQRGACWNRTYIKAAMNQSFS